MENINVNEQASSLNFNELFAEFWRKKYIALAMIIAAVLISLIYNKAFSAPMYTTCAKIYVANSSAGQISSANITVASYLTRDYSELIIDRTVLDEVNKRLKLNYSYGSLKSMVTVNNPQNTRILEIYVQAAKPKDAQLIANEICKVAQEKIVELLEVDNVNIFSDAYLPSAPNNNGLKNSAAVGLICGALAVCAFVFLSYMRNDKISGADDVQKYLGLCTLGTIPYSAEKSRKNSRSKAARATNGKK